MTETVNHPLVSIIMAVYNAQSYVQDAINSVIDQDYFNWELLVINDGSTDDSLTVIKGFKDKRIKLYSQSNKGVSNARNRGLKSMKGDFFCFLDADDVLTSNSLSLRMSGFVSDDICFVDGNVEILDSTMRKKLGTWTPRSTDNVLKSLIRMDARCFFGPTWMVRNTGSANFRFDEDLTHAEELLFYMSHSGLGRYAFTKEVILRYRRSPRSAMTNLISLARSYTLLGNKINDLPGEVSVRDKLVFHYKIRKIMFLSFLRSGNLGLALKYGISGCL